jgi:hypothetical protein
MLRSQMQAFDTGRNYISQFCAHRALHYGQTERFVQQSDAMRHDLLVNGIAFFLCHML